MLRFIIGTGGRGHTSIPENSIFFLDKYRIASVRSASIIFTEEFIKKDCGTIKYNKAAGFTKLTRKMYKAMRNYII